LLSAIVFRGFYKLSSSSNTEMQNGVLTQVGGVPLGDHNASLLAHSISLDASIVPSHISSNNKALLEFHTVDEESGAEEFFSEDKADNILPGYFKFGNTEDYFTSAKFDKEYIPLGSAKPMCLHLDWIPIGKKN
jgi:hypothetical protein